jgi:hypothetical protein
VSGCNELGGGGATSSSNDGSSNERVMTSESAVRMSSLDEQGGFEELLEQHAITLAIQVIEREAPPPPWTFTFFLPRGQSNLVFLNVLRV